MPSPGTGGTTAAVPPTDERTADDATLIAASRQHGEHFAALYDRHAPTLFRYAARRLGPEAAEDVVAETFLVAFRIRGRYDPGRPDARPWLLGILTRELGRRRRAEAARYRLLAALPGPEHHDGPAEAVARAVTAHAARAPLAGALGRLRPGDRDVLLLVAWAGLAYAEVATALDVPVGTVRSRLNRARRLMRAELGAHLDHDHFDAEEA
jgi:RNA polymerase sigma factor (sigma-70 family)